MTSQARDALPTRLLRHAWIAIPVFSIAHVLRPADLGTSMLVEDAGYALGAARHLALGHGISVDGVHPTTGVQPLWVLLLAPLYACTGGDRFSTLRAVSALSAVVWLGLAAALAAIARRWAAFFGAPQRAAGAWALAVAALSSQLFAIVHNGLETGLCLLVLALAVLLLERRFAPDAPKLALDVGSVVALAALVWTRLDAVFLFAAWTLATAWVGLRSRRFPWIALAPAIAAASVAPWLWRTWTLVGSPFPSSATAQAAAVVFSRNVRSALFALGALGAPSVPVPPWGFDLLGTAILGTGTAVIGTAVAAAAAIGLARAWRARPASAPRGVPIGGVALAIQTAAACVVYTVAFGAPQARYRYFSPVLVLVVPALGVLLARVARRPAAARAAVAAAFVANAPSMAIRATSFPREAARRLGSAGHTYDVARWAAAHVSPRCTVGAWSSGAIGYVVPRTVNLDGKVDARAAAFVAALRDAEPPADLAIDVVISLATRPEPDDPDLAPRYRLGELHTPENPSRFYALWVRRGREACVDAVAPLPTATAAQLR